MESNISIVCSGCSGVGKTIPAKRGSIFVKVAASTASTYKSFGEDYWASCLRELPRLAPTYGRSWKRPGNLAGTVDQNLRNRCHQLSRLSKRWHVQSGAVAALLMQQSTGVIQMSTVHNEKTHVPASCENTTLFRYVLLLPRIVRSSPSRSSVGQSIPMSASATGRYRYKGARRLFTHLIVNEKNKEVMIETP